jgi:hypothetical protein
MLGAEDVKLILMDFLENEKKIDLNFYIKNGLT